MEYEAWLVAVGAKMRAVGKGMFCTKPGAWWYEKWKAGVTVDGAVAIALKEGME